MFLSFCVLIKSLARTLSDMMTSIAIETMSTQTTINKKYGRISIPNFDPSKLTGSKGELEEKRKENN
jgi:hypothetical protein